VSGLFGFDCEDVILRASVHEAAIHYAILAVGRIHRDLGETRGMNISSHADEWATKQYCMSIRTLTVGKDRDLYQHMDVVLATCALYACLEVIIHSYSVQPFRTAKINSLGQLERLQSVVLSPTGSVGNIHPSI
jgi:hypothetical protein